MDIKIIIMNEQDLYLDLYQMYDDYVFLNGLNDFVPWKTCIINWNTLYLYIFIKIYNEIKNKKYTILGRSSW